MIILFILKISLGLAMDCEGINTKIMSDLAASSSLKKRETNIIMCEEETPAVGDRINKNPNSNIDIVTENYIVKPEEIVKFNTSINTKVMNANVVSLGDNTLINCNNSDVVAIDSHIVNRDQTTECVQNTILEDTLDLCLGNDKQNITMWDDLLDEPIDVPAGLSKRQRKRYIRKVLWETKLKPLKRAKEKAKLKQRKLQARINNETLGPSRKKLKHSTMAASECKLRIVLDFSFDNLMSEKDLGKCLKQLNHCYCLNRRADKPLQFYVTNFSGPAKNQLGRGVAYENWDIHFHDDQYLNLFKKEELVYLTSDSDKTLTQLDHSKVYIIGALVDHNKYKGKTLEIAKNQGISHAKLPISEFLQMNSRRVLTIDHVFEILVHVSEGNSWKDSFLKVLPQRKGAIEKNAVV